MVAPTLLVGRTLLSDVKEKTLRKYILYNLSNSWDKAYGPESDENCPNIPLEIKTYNFKVNHWIDKEDFGEKFIKHEYLSEMEEFKVGISQVTGGSPSRFLSAILWACFKTEHVMVLESLVIRPKVGEAAIISKYGDKRYQDSGIIVSVNMKRMGAQVKFDDSDEIEGFRFSSFVNFYYECYPFPPPPDHSTLPEGCKTLNQVIHIEDPLTLSQFAVALLHLRD